MNPTRLPSSPPRIKSLVFTLALLTPLFAESFPVTLTVDAAKPISELKPIWKFFGADEPNYATMKDGRKLLHELGELAPKQIYFRAHNLLTSGDGTPDLKWGSTNVYTEDAQGEPAKPSPAQYAELEEAAQLAQVTPAPAILKEAELSLTLPRQAVSLFVLEW